MPSADFSVPFLNANQGAAAAGATQQAAQAAANFVCGLYKNYPGWLAGAPDPTGIGGALHGFYGELCKDRPSGLPELPPVPFSGGQCAGVNYRVNYNYSNQSGVSSSGNFVLLGPIGAAQKTSRTQGSFTFDTWKIPTGNGPFTAVQDIEAPSTFTITSVVRLDGNADNCGSLQPSFPTNTPPPGDLADHGPIDVHPDINIDVPIVFVNPPSPPDVVVKVGPFNVNIDLGGFHVHFDPTLPVPTRPDPRPSPPPLPPKDGDECATGDDLDGILDKLDQLLDCDRCEQTKTFHILEGGVANSAVLELPPNTYAVALRLESFPDNIGREDGVSAPDVVYAGWGRFHYGEGTGKRSPFDSPLVTFIPEGMFPPTHFSYTCRRLITAKAFISYYTLPQG